MVQIVDYAQRTNADQENFFALILQSSEIHVVKSKESGRNYITAPKASIPSTFSEHVCQSLIGKQLPGSIRKVEVEEYQFTIEDTGEVITLDYRWEYVFPEEETRPAEIVDDKEVSQPKQEEPAVEI